MPTHLPPLAYFGKTHSVSFAWPHMKQHLHIKNRDKLRRSYKGSKEATAILIAPYLKYQCEKEKLEVQEGAVLSPQSSACSPLSSACSPLSSACSPLSSACSPLSSACSPLSSVLCFQSSVLCPLSSVLCPLSSVLCLQSSVLSPLFAVRSSQWGIWCRDVRICNNNFSYNTNNKTLYIHVPTYLYASIYVHIH